MIAFGQILFLNICRYHYAILLPSLDCGQADPLTVASVIWSDDTLNAEGEKHWSGFQQPASAYADV